MRETLKPRARISLTLFISLACIGIALLPVLIYSALSMVFFRTGIDSLHEAQLTSAIGEYARQTAGATAGAPVPTGGINRLHVTARRQELPPGVREALPPALHDETRMSVIADGAGENESIYVVLTMPLRGTRYYAYQRVSRQEGETFIRPQILSTIYLLLGTGGVILVVLLVFLLYVIRRIKQPTKALSQWTAALDAENIDAPLPDFVYPEVYAIAGVIQESLKRQYRIAKREELIWRYCSHELRTPISVMRVGLDLLKKTLGRQERNTEQEIRILSRLQRSTYSMSHLVGTLLWLGRTDIHPLPNEHIELSLFLHSVINDVRRLFPHDCQKLRIRVERHVSLIPGPALRIVLENIIRNAFQHALGNAICILQRGTRITVTNTMGRGGALRGDTGFGLGLELTERLTAKLGWRFGITHARGYTRATLVLPS
ncbi:HAMP domain-containing sensor histidine kinase [uncultured Desulfovibrio sp.]|uniref:sensor histidine kinase n=1 Tax=uncultured Desulfovibrio sp. TaxID=167968 RepID=UPI00263AF7CF|nr:HAMP domain-containing sensor histidine kinase [uncultured Desulfovibrio sp.]